MLRSHIGPDYSEGIEPGTHNLTDAENKKNAKFEPRALPDPDHQDVESTQKPQDSSVHPPYPPGFESTEPNAIPIPRPPPPPSLPGSHHPDPGQKSGLRRLELTVSTFLYETVDSNGRRTFHSGPVIVNPPIHTHHY